MKTISKATRTRVRHFRMQRHASYEAVGPAFILVVSGCATLESPCGRWPVSAGCRMHIDPGDAFAVRTQDEEVELYLIR